MSLADRIKEARQMKHMTQEALARAIGVSKGSIGNYETGVSSPIEPVLIKLMEVLDVDANFIYQDYIHIDHGSLSDAESRLINAYRSANAQAQNDALNILLSHQNKKDTAKTAT